MKKTSLLSKMCMIIICAFFVIGLASCVKGNDDAVSSLADDTVTSLTESEHGNDVVTPLPEYEHEQDLAAYFYNLTDYFFKPMEEGKLIYSDDILTLAFRVIIGNDEYLDGIKYDKETSLFECSGATFRLVSMAILGDDFDFEYYNEFMINMPTYNKESDTYTAILATDYLGGDSHSTEFGTEPKITYTDTGATITACIEHTNINFAKLDPSVYLKYEFDKVVDDGFLFYRLKSVSLYPDSTEIDEINIPKVNYENNLESYLSYFVNYFNKPFTRSDEMPRYDILALVAQFCANNRDSMEGVEIVNYGLQIKYDGESFRNVAKNLLGDDIDIEYYNDFIGGFYYDKEGDYYLSSAEEKYHWGGSWYFIKEGTTPEITENGSMLRAVVTIEDRNDYKEVKDEPRELTYTFEKIDDGINVYYQIISVKDNNSTPANSLPDNAFPVDACKSVLFGNSPMYYTNMGMEMSIEDYLANTGMTMLKYTWQYKIKNNRRSGWK
jgi:hypothetical protein